MWRSGAVRLRGGFVRVGQLRTGIENGVHCFEAARFIARSNLANAPSIVIINSA